MEILFNSKLHFQHKRGGKSCWKAKLNTLQNMIWYHSEQLQSNNRIKKVTFLTILNILLFRFSLLKPYSLTIHVTQMRMGFLSRFFSRFLKLLCLLNVI